MAFPYGDLRNDPGNGTGTPVDRVLLSDVMQTMEKIMNESGISPNGQLDNETNGFQIFEAMQRVFGNNVSTDWADLPGAQYESTYPEGKAQYLRDSGGFVHFRGVWNSDDPQVGDPLGTLPVGFRPAADFSFDYTWCNNPGSNFNSNAIRIKISATGVITCTSFGLTREVRVIQFPLFKAVY